MNSLFPEEPEFFRTEKYSVVRYDLPDADITLYNGFFSESESNHLYNVLLKTIEWSQETINYFGKIYDLPRLTAWYGDNRKPYTYSGIPMNPTPWTKELLLIKEKLEIISEASFTSVLLNQYRNGNDSVAWHSDDERELGIDPIIASVSFGETRTFQLKHKYQKNIKENIHLTNGSILLMQGKTQAYWKHQIPKSSRPLRTRINLTFRNIF